MQPVSTAYMAAIVDPSRIVRIAGTITLNDLSTVEISDTNIIKGSLYISSQCVSGDDIDVGSVFISEMGLSLVSEMENPYTLDGARINLNFGVRIDDTTYEYVPMGYFYVTEIRRKPAFIALKAYDGLIMFDVDFSGVVTTGTPYEIVSSCCSKAGVNLATAFADFNLFANYAEEVALPADSSVKTCRDLIMWICQLTGTFARMNRVGQLEICMLGVTSGREITADERFATEISDTEVQITKISMAVGDVTYTQGIDGMTMNLEANPLFSQKTESEINTALANILSKISAIQYTPCRFDMAGDPSLDAGDMITLTGPNITDTTALITKTTWWYRGKQSIEAVGKNGRLKSTYSQTLKAITTITQIASQAHDLATAANQSTQLLNDAIGGNVLIRKKENGTNEVVIMDSNDPATAMRVWRWNMGGLGYSDNCIGVDNPARTYSVAMTMDGSINASFIKSGKLQAIEVESLSGTFTNLITGVPNAQRMEQGTDQNGEPFIKMYDRNNTPKLALDMDEITWPNGIKIAEFSIGNTFGVGLF